MSKKTKIQIAIIVVMFGASGIVLYMGLGSSPKPVPQFSPAVSLPSTVGVTSSASDALLPYGDQLPFAGVIKNSRFNYDTNKIILDPETEVGVTTDNLITVAPPK